MFMLFFVLWVIFNGRISAEIAAIGVVIAVLLFCFICKFMDYSRNILRGASYLLLLLAEIIKANYSVICLILSPKYEIEPKLVKFRVDLKSDTLRAVLADSITLTPGTITVTLEGDEYLEFVRKLKEFERGGKGEEDGTIL